MMVKLLAMIINALMSAGRAISSQTNRNQQDPPAKKSRRAKLSKRLGSRKSTARSSLEIDIHVEIHPPTPPTPSQDSHPLDESATTIESSLIELVPRSPSLRTIDLPVEGDIFGPPPYLTATSEADNLLLPRRSLSGSTSSFEVSETSSWSGHPVCTTPVEVIPGCQRDLDDSRSPLEEDGYLDPISLQLSSDAQQEATRDQVPSLHGLPEELLVIILGFAFNLSQDFTPSSRRHRLAERAEARRVCRLWKTVIDEQIALSHFAIPDVFMDDQTGDCTNSLQHKPNITEGRTFEEVSFHICEAQSTNHPRRSTLLNAAMANTRSLWMSVDSSGRLSPDTESEHFNTSNTDFSLLRRLTWISPYIGLHHSLPSSLCIWQSLWLGVPWCQLTQLSMDCPMSAIDARQILSVASSLVFLRVRINTETSEPYDDRVLMTCPSLHDVHISSNASLNAIFSNATMPELSKLSLEILPDALGLFFAPFDDTMDIPWSQLQILSIDNQSFERFPIASILSKTTSMRELALNGSSYQFSLRPIAFENLDRLALGTDFRDIEQVQQLFAETSISTLQISFIPQASDVLALPEASVLILNPVIRLVTLVALEQALRSMFTCAHFTINRAPEGCFPMTTPLVLKLTEANSDLDSALSLADNE